MSGSNSCDVRTDFVDFTPGVNKYQAGVGLIQFRNADHHVSELHNFITSSNIFMTDYQNSFLGILSSKFLTKWSLKLHISQTLRCTAHTT